MPSSGRNVLQMASCHPSVLEKKTQHREQRAGWQLSQLLLLSAAARCKAPAARQRVPGQERTCGDPSFLICTTIGQRRNWALVLFLLSETNELSSLSLRLRKLGRPQCIAGRERQLMPQQIFCIACYYYYLYRFAFRIHS